MMAAPITLGNARPARIIHGPPCPSPPALVSASNEITACGELADDYHACDDDARDDSQLLAEGAFSDPAMRFDKPLIATVTLEDIPTAGAR